MPRAKAARYQIRSDEPTPDMVVEFHARYAKPYDDTTVLNVFHRTTDGGVGVLIERNEFHQLAEWLTADWSATGEEDYFRLGARRVDENGVPLYYRGVRQTVGQFMIHDLQTTAILSKPGNLRPGQGRALGVAVFWNGSERPRSAVLNEVEVGLLTEWMADVDTNGWVGWKSSQPEMTD